jgi:hypothetical protein
MKANDLLFRIKELIQDVDQKHPLLTDGSGVENIQRIADLTRTASELHQRLIMLETLIHKEKGLESNQNAAMRNFLKELKQVVAIGKEEDDEKTQFIQFVQTEKKEAIPFSPEPKKTEIVPEVKPIETPIEIKAEIPITPEVKIEIVPEPNIIATTAAKPESPISNKPVTLAINDRFRIMNELFSKQAHKLDENIQVFNSASKPEAHVRWLSLASEFSWDEEAEIVKTFKAVIFNRYA